MYSHFCIITRPYPPRGCRQWCAMIFAIYLLLSVGSMLASASLNDKQSNHSVRLPRQIEQLPQKRAFTGRDDFLIAWTAWTPPFQPENKNNKNNNDKWAKYITKPSWRRRQRAPAGILGFTFATMIGNSPSSDTPATLLQRACESITATPT